MSSGIKKDMNLFENVQHRETRMIHGFYGVSEEMPLKHTSKCLSGLSGL